MTNVKNWIALAVDFTKSNGEQWDAHFKEQKKAETVLAVELVKGDKTRTFTFKQLEELLDSHD